jgi:uncharacterized protein (DUF1810 family)
MKDVYNLERFLDPQEDTYGRALIEIRGGRKIGHWMWFIFPQISGLGRSPMAQLYAISGLAEAKAYLEHPILGQRLRDITVALQSLPDASAEDVFGTIDALKLRSSLTLFALAKEDGRLFRQALDRWFDGVEDPATLERL